MYISMNVNSVYLPRSINKESLHGILKRSFDVFQAVRESDKEDKVVGMAILALNSDEIESIIESINTTRDYYVLGIGDIRLFGTSIVTNALIIESI